MSKYILKDYVIVKNQLDQEVKKNPDKEHELTLLYSPVLNYHAVKFVEKVLLEKRIAPYLSEKEKETV